jgi:hypothetical protein
MAGHFLLYSIEESERDQCLAEYGNSRWGELEHHTVEWNGASRGVLQRVRDRLPIENRAGLPPHRYLSFPAGQPTGEKAKFLFSYATEWILKMQRPATNGLGLRTLCPAAMVEWDLGRKREALAAQISHGTTSIEVYYLGTLEMF